MNDEPGKIARGAVAAVALLPALVCGQPAAQEEIIQSEAAAFRVEEVADGLQVPWAIAFLPGNRALISERAAGRIRLADLADGTMEAPAGGPDDVFIKDNGGMLDVVLHPAFDDNGWVYYCYTAGDLQLSTTVVERVRLTEGHFEGRERLLAAQPWYHNSIVYGCRLAFSGEYLFISMGERWDLRHLAQSPGTHLGKILRVHHDGSAPADNPYADVPGALPEVWALGSRNAQGLTVHPDTGELWSHEHGPLGGDEINVIEPGRNYGWPVVTYGLEYSGEPVGEGLTEYEGMEQPLYTYIPSIAPSDMVFYTGSAFPQWQGNLFIGALAGTHINRLVIDGRDVVHEERLLHGRGWRIPFVKQGPDDLIYFGTGMGTVYRLVPAAADR